MSKQPLDHKTGQADWHAAGDESGLHLTMHVPTAVFEQMHEDRQRMLTDAIASIETALKEIDKPTRAGVIFRATGDRVGKGVEARDESTLNAGGSTFRVEQDYEEFRTAMPEADKNWRATDSNGHEHYWDGGWPTLEWVVTGTYWCEMHNEEHDEGEWRCRQCGEPVEPGMRNPGPRVITVPTMRHYFIDEQPVDEETFKRRVAEAEAEKT